MFLLIFLFSGEVLEPVIRDGSVIFRYKDENANRVSIAGEFNNWTKDRDFMKKILDTFEYEIKLKPGRYEYKFIIDGEWMPGENLVVFVKEKDGVLSLEVPKPKPALERFKFSGKFSGEIPYSIESNSTATVHTDLDLYFSAFTDLNGFLRMEIENPGSVSNVRFLQADIEFGDFNFFYNRKSIQFDDPLKALDEPVSIRYSTITKIDELSPFAKKGTGAIGLKYSQSFITAYIMNSMKNKFFDFHSRAVKTLGSITDEVGLRLKYASNKFTAGSYLILNRGIHFPFANEWEWFPDPVEAINKNSLSSISTWYNGFVHSYNYGFDVVLKPDILNLYIFGELKLGNRWLKAERWNEGKNLDVAIDRSWSIDKNSQFFYGFGSRNFEVIKGNKNFKLEFLNRETSLNHTSVILRLPYISLRYFVDEWEPVETMLPAATYFFIPYSENLFFSGKEPDVLYSAFYPYKKTGYEAGFSLKDTNIFIKDINFYERGDSRKALQGIFNSRIRFYRNAGFYFSGRYSGYDFASSTFSFITYFAGIELKIKNGYLRIGYGIDPEGFDEDVLLLNDRVDMLLESFFDPLKNREDAIFDAYKKLSDIKQILVKVLIRF